ncbi:hypothetical protein EVAR_11981_1 [Eumeta japonica]|uniref:Uncharacterized protein n=1 Tax=Eumeta variegata TaxID=151549 RepID=A0A4C1U4Y7_EUMVA|nr:hypothetical protein EVAR_11981_1 [Eumeta japonica]
MRSLRTKWRIVKTRFDTDANSVYFEELNATWSKSQQINMPVVQGDIAHDEARTWTSDRRQRGRVPPVRRGVVDV